MKFRLFAALVSMMLMFSSCGSFDLPDAVKSVDSQTKGRIYAEQFLPPDFERIMVLNTKDDVQRLIFEGLESRLQLENGFAHEVIKQVMNRLVGYGVSYMDEIKPIFGKNYRVLWGEKGEDYFAVATVYDIVARDAFLAKLSGLEEFVGADYGTNKLIGDSKNQLHLMIYEDLLLFSNTRQNLIEAVDRYELKASTIENNPDFVQFAENVNTSDFFYYYDKGRGAALRLDAKRARIFGYDPVGGGLASMEDSESFADEIFKDELIGYFEGYDFATILEDKMKGQNPGTYDAFKQSFETSTGLSFNDDILSFLKGRYSVSLHDNGGVLPGIVFLTDASGNLESAKKVVEALDKQAESIAASLKASYSDEVASDDLVLRKNLSVDGGVGYMLEIDFGLLVTSVESEKFALSFGLTGDNIFYLSTYKDFAYDFGKKGLEFSSEIQEGSLSKKSLNGVLYVAFKPFTSFANRLFDVRDEIEKLVGKEYLDFYDKNNSYLNPFRDGIFYLRGDKKLEGFLNFD